MTSLPKLFFSIILILVLTPSGLAKTSTKNLIIEKSDILTPKKTNDSPQAPLFGGGSTNQWPTVPETVQ